MNSRVNPVFATALAAFGGHGTTIKPPHKVLIAIDPMEIEVQVRSADRNGPAEYQTITVPDQATKEAIEKVLARADVIDYIEAELQAMHARGKV